MALYEKKIYTFLFGLLITTTLTIPLVGTQNIDCNGKAFHCVNSTHFKICVDLGGVSTTVDDFLIPCPRNTVCKDNNYFECEYQATTTPPPTEQSDVSNDENSVTSTWENFGTLTLTTSSDVELSRVISSTLTSELKLQILNNETVNGLVDLSPINSANEYNNSNSDKSVSENYNSTQSTVFEAVTYGDGLSTTLPQVTLDNTVFNSTDSLTDLSKTVLSTENILISDKVLPDSLNGITTEIYNSDDIRNNTATFSNISVPNKNISEVYFNISNPSSDISEHTAFESTTEAMNTVSLIQDDNQGTLTTAIFGTTKDLLINLDTTTLPYPIDRIANIRDEHVLTQENITFVNITVQLEKDSINSMNSTNSLLLKNISDSVSTTPTHEFMSTEYNKIIDNTYDITNASKYENESTAEKVIPHHSIDINILNYTGTEMMNISENQPMNSVTELNMTEPGVLLNNVSTLNISNIHLHHGVNETKDVVTSLSYSDAIQENVYAATVIPKEFKHSELSVNYENNTQNFTKPIQIYIPLTTTESTRLYISKEPEINTNKTFISHQTNLSTTANYIPEGNYSEAPPLIIQKFDLHLPSVDAFDSTTGYKDNTFYVNSDIKTTTTTVNIKDEHNLSISPVLESANPISIVSTTESIIMQDTNYVNTEEVTPSVIILNNLNSRKMYLEYSTTDIPRPDTTSDNGVTIQEILTNITSSDAVLNESNLLTSLSEDNNIADTAYNSYTNDKKYRSILNITEATTFAIKSTNDSDISKVINEAPTNLIYLQNIDTSTETSTTPDKLTTNADRIDTLTTLNNYTNYQNDKIVSIDTHYNEGIDVTTVTPAINFNYNNYDSTMVTISENEINDNLKSQDVDVGTNLSLIGNSETSTFYYKNSQLSTIMQDIENIKKTNVDKSYTQNVSTKIGVGVKNLSTNDTVTKKVLLNESMTRKLQAKENSYAPNFDSVTKTSSALSLDKSNVTLNNLFHKPAAIFLQTLNYENYLQDSKNNTDRITEPTLPPLNQSNYQSKLNKMEFNNSNNIMNTVLNQTLIMPRYSYEFLNQSEILTKNNPKVRYKNYIEDNTGTNLDFTQNAQLLNNETKPLLKASNISLNDREITALSNLSTNVKNLALPLKINSNITNSIFNSQDIKKHNLTLSVPAKIEMKNTTIEVPNPNPIIISSSLPSTSPTLIQLQEAVTESKVIQESSLSTLTKLEESLNGFSMQKNSTNDNVNIKAETMPTNLSPKSSDRLTTYKYEATSYPTILQSKIFPEPNRIYKSIVDVNTRFSSKNINQNDKILINAEINKSKNPGQNKNPENTNTKAFTTTSVHTGSSKSLNCTKNLKSETTPKTQFICPKRGKYSDEKNCNKFYICIGKHDPIVGICPNNSVFSEIRKQCTKNLSHCVRNNQFRCLAAGRFIDVLTKNVYYICVKKNEGYVRFKLQCQKGYYLNTDNIQCTQDSEYSVEDSSKSTSEKSTSETKSDLDFVCEDDGKFAHPEDSQKYYVCSKNSKSQYRRKLKKCNSDEVFDKDKRKCVDDDSSE